MSKTREEQLQEARETGATVVQFSDAITKLVLEESRRRPRAELRKGWDQQLKAARTRRELGDVLVEKEVDKEAARGDGAAKPDGAIGIGVGAMNVLFKKGSKAAATVIEDALKTLDTRPAAVKRNDPEQSRSQLQRPALRAVDRGRSL